MHTGRGLHVNRFRVWTLLLLGVAAVASCNSIKNAWLDPTVLGSFDQTTTMEIRTSLTLEDTPLGIPGAAGPIPEDRDVIPIEFPISAGDTLAVEINELRQRQIPFQAQSTVSSTGYVNLPVIGHVDAAGYTVPQFEREIVNALLELDVLRTPEVNVNPIFLQKATYSIFGIGVSAADNAPLRAGTFPIRRPDLTILDAINQVGGLNEFVTDVYVFRTDDPPWMRERREVANDTGPSIDRDEQPVPKDILENIEPETEEAPAKPPDQRSDAALEQELFDAVVADTDRSGQPEPAVPPTDETPKELSPEAPEPYMYVNGEWVRDPAYGAGTLPAAPQPISAPLFDTATPAVSWARIAGDTSYRIIHIVADQLRSGDPEVNIVVRAGDVIRIISGEIGVYYVMGQVRQVGAYRFNAEKITLKSAIAAAGGLSSLAWPDRCTVYRRIGRREQMIQVDLDRIFAGKDADFLIRRGDIVNVGTHPLAPFLQRIRAWTLPNPVSNIGYSYTYSRNFADIDSFSARSNPHNEPSRFPALFP